MSDHLSPSPRVRRSDLDNNGFANSGFFWRGTGKLSGRFGSSLQRSVILPSESRRANAIED
jgi:hypothetical protein